MVGRAGCCSGGQSSVKLLSACLLMGGAEFPPCWLFGLRHPSTGAYRLFSVANGRLWDGSHQGVLPRTSDSRVLVPAVSHSCPPSLQETLQH